MHRRRGLEGSLDGSVRERLQVVHVEQNLREVVALGVAADNPVGRLAAAARDVAQLVLERLGRPRLGQAQAARDRQGGLHPVEHERRVRSVHDVEVDVEEFLQEPRLAGDDQVGEGLRLGRSGELVDEEVAAAAAADRIAAAEARRAADRRDPGGQAGAPEDRLSGAAEGQVHRGRRAAGHAELDVGLEAVDVLVVGRAGVDAGGEDLGQGQPAHGNGPDDEVLLLEKDHIGRVADARGHLLGDRLVAVLEQVEQVGAGVDDELDVAARRLALDRVERVDLEQGGDPVERRAGVRVENGDPERAADHRRELAVGEVDRTDGPRRRERRWTLRVGRVVADQVGNADRAVTDTEPDRVIAQEVGDRSGQEGPRRRNRDTAESVARAVEDLAAEDRVAVLEKHAAGVLAAENGDGLVGR